MDLDNNNDNYLPDSQSTEFVKECEAAEAIFKPLSYNKKTIKPKKKTKKQMTLKTGLKNMKEKNFQGYDIERCTVIPNLDICVYIPKSYGSKTRKKYKNKFQPATNGVCCGHCFLMPCSMIEFYDELYTVCSSEGMLMRDDDVAHGDLLIKVRIRYRALMTKAFGKGYANKTMPFNSSIPQCALQGTAKLADIELDRGYDSLLEDSPFTRDCKLNERDNRMEKEEMTRAARELDITAGLSSDEEEFEF